MKKYSVRFVSKSENDLFHNLAVKQHAVFSQDWFTKLQPEIKKLGFYSGSKLVGGLCLIQVSKFGLNFTRGPSFAPNCGAFLETTRNNPYKLLVENKYFLESLADFVMNSSLHIFRLSLPPEFVDIQPLIWRNFDVRPSYTYQINLHKNFNGDRELTHFMSSDIQRRARNMLNTKIEEIEFCKEVLQPIIDTFNRARIKYNEELVQKIFETSKDPSSPCRIFVAKVDGQVVASLALILNRERSYLLMCGHLQGFSNAYLNLILHSIDFAKKNGSNMFDFEGSMNKSIEKFFRQFGGEILPYWDIIKAPFPINLAIRKLQNKSYLK